MAVTIAYTGVLANGSSYAAGTGSGQFDTTKEEIIIDCTLTLSGSYVAGGDTLDFTSVAPPIGASLFSYAPTQWTLNEQSIKGTALSGFSFYYVPGPTLALPTQAGGGLQIFGTGAASGQGGTEVSAGTYASTTPSLDGKVIRARFWFSRN